MTREHTLLINMVVGLCHRDPFWPSILRDLGYTVKFLERVLMTTEKERTKPDIIAVSNRFRHILIIECKSGTSISAEQDGKYGRLGTMPVATEIRAGKFIDRHTVAYAIGHAGLAEIERQTSRPIIVFAPSYVQGSGKFGVVELDKKICGRVPLDSTRAPTKYYPFGPDDDSSVVITHIIQCIVKFTRENRPIKNMGDDDSVSDMFDEVFEFQKILPKPHVKDLKKKIKKTIEEDLATNKELMGHMAEVRKNRNPKTLARLYGYCDMYMKKTMPQKKLADFGE